MYTGIYWYLCIQVYRYITVFMCTSVPVYTGIYVYKCTGTYVPLYTGIYEYSGKLPYRY